jgi:hypothetical protein
MNAEEVMTTDAGQTDDAVTPEEVRQRIAELAKPTPLDMAREFNARYIFASPGELDAITLWQAHTYAYKLFNATPRLAVLSMEPGCGKTVVLEITKIMSARAIRTSNASAPAIFAIVEQRDPTLLFDEADAIFGSTGHGRAHEELRGLLNDGYFEGGSVLRSRGGTAVEFPVYCPVALAGLGLLPKTLMDRSVVIRMKKPANGGSLMDWEPDLAAEEGKAIARALEAFIVERAEDFSLFPEMPAGVVLRSKQIWKPLISIADAVGLNWGSRARRACREIVLGTAASPVKSPLEDLVTSVKLHCDPAKPVLTTSELIEELRRVRQNTGSLAWATWLDDPVTAARAIAKLVNPYGIESFQTSVGGHSNRRAYRIADFALVAETLAADQEASQQNSGPRADE